MWVSASVSSRKGCTSLSAETCFLIAKGWGQDFFEDIKAGVGRKGSGSILEITVVEKSPLVMEWMGELTPARLPNLLELLMPRFTALPTEAALYCLRSGVTSDCHSSP